MAVCEFLTLAGIDNNPKIKPDGKYGIDFLYIHVIRIGVDVEVKEKWGSSSWPKKWKTVHIVNRKLKNLNMVGIKFDVLEFWVLNKSLTTAVIIKGDTFKKSVVKRIECHSENYTGPDDIRDILFSQVDRICHLETGITEYLENPYKENKNSYAQLSLPLLYWNE